MANGPENRGALKGAIVRTRQGCRGVVARGLFAALVLLPGALASRTAQACSAPNPSSLVPTIIPRDGANDVPTATSIVIISPTQPTQVGLQGSGLAIDISPLTAIGNGRDEATGVPVVYWLVRPVSGRLPGSAEVRITMADGHGGILQYLIRTAPSYDKQQGTAAVLKSLTLTRIRYPVSEINSGNCVFAEYIGFASFEADPASVPGTPADSVVNTVELSPKHGGAATQSRAFTGEKSYSGTATGNVTSSGEWYPDLDPTLEYCATIKSFGYGDIARLPLESNTVCARVTELLSPSLANDAGTDATTADASPDSGAQDAACAAPDVYEGVDTPVGAKSGCSAAGTPTETLSTLGTLFALCLIAGAALRPRESAISREGRGRRS
jgi:hypothetical protein